MYAPFYCNDSSLIKSGGCFAVSDPAESTDGELLLVDAEERANLSGGFPT